MKKLSVIVLGDINVGKTRLCHLLKNDYIKYSYKPTTVVDYFTFRKNNNLVSMWDTGNCVFINNNSTSFMKYCKVVIFVCNSQMRTIKFIQDYMQKNREFILDKQCMLVYFGNDFSETTFQDFMKNNFLKIFKIQNDEKDVNTLREYLLKYCDKNCHDDNPSILPEEDKMKSNCDCCNIFSLLLKMSK